MPVLTLNDVSELQALIDADDRGHVFKIDYLNFALA